EPLMQKEFMTEFLKRLKQEGIHVVAETTGCVEHEYFKDIIHYIDTLYFDVKHPDTKIHKEKTGKGNAKILENLQYALSVNKDVTARIPMIPDFNFSNKTAYKYIELFKKIGIKKVHLLPFHQYGSEKYKMLGLSYGYKNFENIAKEELKPIKKIFKENGFEVRIGG
ncbi:MAG: radical SAM protein, partial [Oscillospiraceae bacterium]